MNKGHAKHKPTQALLLIDVINNFEFPDGELLLRRALEIAPRLAALKRRAAKVGVPIIYVNDNFGQWHSNAAKLLASCLHTDCPVRSWNKFNPAKKITASLNQCIRRSTRRRSTFFCVT